MESMEGISEREWISLCGSYSAEESEIMAALLSNYSFPSLSMEIPAAYWPGNGSALSILAAADDCSYYSSEVSESNTYGFSQGNNYAAESAIFASSVEENFNFSDSHPLLMPLSNSLSMDYCMDDVRNADFCPIQEDNGLSLKMGQNLVLKPTADPVATVDKSLQIKRKAVVAIEATDLPNSLDAGKTKRSMRTRKRQKLASTSHDEEDQIISSNVKSRIGSGSEDDSDVSQQINGGVASSSSSKGSATLNSNGKPRASRGSATDPQSLYARKRRERINERLKVLQSLVPNGTKVDISTMLEEAVQYVKFLQLQIKLLSSDDLWMYAPIAYNGMDIGLNPKLMKEDNTSQ